MSSNNTSNTDDAGATNPANAGNGNNNNNSNNNRTGARGRMGNRNERSNNRSEQNNNSFVPKLQNVESLGTLKENRKQNFNKFQKSLHHHVMTSYKNSKDMSKCITEFIEPISEIEKEMKTLSQIRKSKPIYTILPPK